MGQRTGGAILHEAAVIEDFLELCRCCGALPKGQVGLAANVNRMRAGIATFRCKIALPEKLMKWEFPRLCRGGSQTLRIPGVYLPLLPSFCRSPLPREPRAVAVASAFQRLRSGPFEGPATVKPPALPEDTYFVVQAAIPRV